MRIKSGFVLRDVAGQTMVVATGEASKDFHGLIKLNPTAKDIWLWLSEGKGEDEIVALLCEKYDVSTDKAQTDLKVMLDKMDKAGFLIND